jgi:single-strand selective monofunctional uracil DNA glycosylase
VDLETITAELTKALSKLNFGAPVTHVYNPLAYAAAPYRQYVRRYGSGPKEVVLLGMNPGPWGMAQTGVPFGEVVAVREWLGIEAPVAQPERLHPRRPIQGFACSRREVSGQRLWGWAQKNFGSPARFFRRFFVANYCPLMFFDADGRNITPNQLKAADRKPLLAACDRALARTAAVLAPRCVVGIGNFAAERARAALGDGGIKVGSVTHPSPANPKANRGWEKLVNRELAEIGIRL